MKRQRPARQPEAPEAASLLLELPRELLVHIAGLLDKADLLHCRIACKALQEPCSGVLRRAVIMPQNFFRPSRTASSRGGSVGRFPPL